MDQVLNILIDTSSDRTTAFIEISFMLIVSFMIGTLTVWFYHKLKIMLMNSKLRRMKNDVLLYQEEAKYLRTEKDKIGFSYKSLREDNNKLTSDYKELKREHERINKILESEKGKIPVDVSGYKEEIKKLEQANNSIRKNLEQEVESLSIQVQKLKEDNEKLKSVAESLKNDAEGYKKKSDSYKDMYEHEFQNIKDSLNAEKNVYASEISSLKIDISKMNSEKEKVSKAYDLSLFNIQVLKEENEFLKMEIGRIKAENERIKLGDKILKDRINEEKKRLEAKEDEFEIKKNLLLQSIGEVSESEKESLRQIRGIGPFIEKKLNQIGVYAIAQIASFTKEDVKRVTELIKYFPGRIERDNWILQAKEILRVRDKNLEIIKRFEA